jgi:nitroreductase
MNTVDIFNNEPAIRQSQKRRYATKIFDPTVKISASEWEILESTLLLSPSGYGLQPWKFIVVQDPQVRQKLMSVSLNQSQVAECSHFVVIAAKTSIDEAYIDSHVSVVAKVRNLPKESFDPYYQMMVDDVIHGPKGQYFREWAARQAYIALGALVTTAALLQIDTCPMEGIIPEQYDEILNLNSTGYRTLACCALGYRSVTDKYANFGKARFEKSQIINYI